MMRILFICGSLEPGLDGVGDYSRRLAAECIRQGSYAAVLALNDRYSSNPVPYFQDDHGTKVQVLRLSSSSSWHQRLIRAKRFVSLFSPTFLSVQYVPYAFSSYGLPVRLPLFISEILKHTVMTTVDATNPQASLYSSYLAPATRIPIHIMFHEVCVGLGSKPPIRHRILGFLQFILAKILVKTCNPKSVHTNSTPYLYILKDITCNITRLPLFSNIERVNGFYSKPNEKVIRMAFFGSVHSGFSASHLVSLISDLQNKIGKRAYLIAMGHGGPYSSVVWQRVRMYGIHVLELGPLAEQQISHCLLKCDIGLSASTPDLIEKSGAAASMFEHGLPVIIPRPSLWHGKYDNEIQEACPLAIFPGQIFHSKILEKQPPTNQTLKSITSKFLSDLNQALRS